MLPWSMSLVVNSYLGAWEEDASSSLRGHPFSTGRLTTGDHVCRRRRLYIKHNNNNNNNNNNNPEDGKRKEGSE